MSTRALRRSRERQEVQEWKEQTVRYGGVRTFRHLQLPFEVIKHGLGTFMQHVGEHRIDWDTWAVCDPNVEFGELIAFQSPHHRVTVSIWKQHPEIKDCPLYLYLSFKRLDREPLGDWRTKQRIKNAILGEEAEAVELFPAESRLMDTSNQYHLWSPLPSLRFDFGYIDRAVVGESINTAELTTKQRPLTDDGGPL